MRLGLSRRPAGLRGARRLFQQGAYVQFATNPPNRASSLIIQASPDSTSDMPYSRTVNMGREKAGYRFPDSAIPKDDCFAIDGLNLGR